MMEDPYVQETSPAETISYTGKVVDPAEEATREGVPVSSKEQQGQAPPKPARFGDGSGACGSAPVVKTEQAEAKYSPVSQATSGESASAAPQQPPPPPRIQKQNPFLRTLPKAQSTRRKSISPLRRSRIGATTRLTRRIRIGKATGVGTVSLRPQPTNHHR